MVDVVLFQGSLLWPGWKPSQSKHPQTALIRRTCQRNDALHLLPGTPTSHPPQSTPRNRRLRVLLLRSRQKKNNLLKLETLWALFPESNLEGSFLSYYGAVVLVWGSCAIALRLALEAQGGPTLRVHWKMLVKGKKKDPF